MSGGNGSCLPGSGSSTLPAIPGSVSPPCVPRRGQGMFSGEKEPPEHSAGVSERSVQGPAAAAPLWEGGGGVWLEEQLCSGPRTECQLSCSLGAGV